MNVNETSANNRLTPIDPIRGRSDSARPSSSSVPSSASPDPITDLEQSPFPLIFLTKEPGGAPNFKALTAAHEVIPFSYPFKPDSAKTPLIFDNCVIVKGVLYTIDPASKRILTLDLNNSSSGKIEIPCLKEPYGITLSSGCPIFWSGGVIYEVLDRNGSLEVKNWGASGFEDMRNLRVLKKKDDRLVVAMNVGNAEAAKVVTILSESRPEVSRQRNAPEWFVGSSKNDLFYIEDGRLQSARDGKIVHEIFERNYFKDSFNVDNIVFLRTRVGEAKSKVTVVDMLTATRLHSFITEGEMKLVQTIAS